MKKIIIFILTLTIILILIKPINSMAKDNNKININIQEETLVKDNNITKVLDDNVYCNNDSTIFIKEEYVLNYVIEKYVKVENDIFAIVNKNSYTLLITIDLATKEVINSINIFSNIYDLVYYNNQVYLVGEEHYDACLYIFQTQNNSLTKHIYGGDNYEAFKCIKIFNNEAYIFGEKNGISENSIFKNVGNTNDLKSFIIKINKKYEIVNECYFNEQATEETIKDIIISSSILVTLKADNKIYYYQLNADLSCIKHYEVKIDNVNDVKLLLESIYLVIHNNTLFLARYNENRFDLTKLLDINSYNYTLIKESCLQILKVESDIIKQYNIFEYHYIYKNPFIYQYPYDDYQSTNHFYIESYFGSLKFEYDSDKNQYIDLHKSNNYVATYKEKNYTFLEIKTDFIVKPFINIINNGIYNLGHILMFTDDAYLNGEKIINGEQLMDIGTYEITHLNNKYIIHVVDNTLINLEDNYLIADSLIKKDEVSTYSIKLNTKKLVIDVIVNNESHPFYQIDSDLYIDFKNNSKITQYHIEKIIFEDGISLIINRHYTIKTINEAPIISLEQSNNNIYYDIKDIDNTIFDVVIKKYQDNVCIEEINTYLKNTNINLTKENIKYQIILRYYLGTDEIEEVELANIVGSKTSSNPIINISFEKNDNSINKIYLSISPIEKTKITSFLALSVDLSNYFIHYENKLIKYISLILSLALITLIIVFAIRRYFKKKHN